MPGNAAGTDGPPSGLRVRAAREADAPELRRFVPAAVDWAVVVSALGALVAMEDDVVRGVIVRWPHPTHVLVERIAVAPHARRGGLGTALLDVVEREAIESGTNTVRAAAGGPHDPFLRAHGYVAVPGSTVLEKRLAP